MAFWMPHNTRSIEEQGRKKIVAQKGRNDSSETARRKRNGDYFISVSSSTTDESSGIEKGGTVATVTLGKIGLIYIAASRLLKTNMCIQIP